jgi:hypothetical protein
MDVVAARLEEEHPETDRGVRARVVPERLARPEEDNARSNAFAAAIMLARRASPPRGPGGDDDGQDRLQIRGRVHRLAARGGAECTRAPADHHAAYEVKKGTVRFPLSEPVPVKLIERIAKVRAKEVAERENAKAAAPKKR